MRNILSLTVVLVYIQTIASHVVELTPSNFNSLVTADKYIWIVEFYSPGCPYCQEFAPEYEATANQLANTNIKVGRVNAEQYDDLSNKYGVRAYPTVKFFKPGSDPMDYHGPRVAANIINTAKGLRKRSLDSPTNGAPEAADGFANGVVFCKDLTNKTLRCNYKHKLLSGMINETTMSVIFKQIFKSLYFVDSMDELFPQHLHFTLQEV